MRTLFFLFLIPVLLCGCSGNERTRNADLITICPDWNRVLDKYDYSALVEDSVLVVPLETNDDCLIGEVTYIIYRNDKIYIADNMHKAVFVFGSNGKLLSKLRALGNGPVEYLNISGFTVYKDHLVIYDHFIGKMFFFDEKGTCHYVKDVSDIWGMDLFCLDDRIYLVNDGSRTNSGFYHLFALHPDGQHTEFQKWLPFQDPGNAGWGVDRYSTCLKDEAMVYYFPYDTLYTVKSGEAYPSYYIDFGKRRLPRNYIYAEGHVALKTAIRDNYISGVKKVVQSDRFIFLGYNDSNEVYTTVYDKQTGETVTATNLYNPKLGRLSLASRFDIQDEHLIQCFSGEHWAWMAQHDNWNLDEREFYSDYLKQRFKELLTVETMERNPVLFIQKMKE